MADAEAHESVGHVTEEKRNKQKKASRDRKSAHTALRNVSMFVSTAHSALIVVTFFQGFGIWDFMPTVGLYSWMYAHAFIFLLMTWWGLYVTQGKNRNKHFSKIHAPVANKVWINWLHNAIVTLFFASLLVHLDSDTKEYSEFVPNDKPNNYATLVEHITSKSPEELSATATHKDVDTVAVQSLFYTAYHVALVVYSISSVTGLMGMLENVALHFEMAVSLAFAPRKSGEKFNVVGELAHAVFGDVFRGFARSGLQDDTTKIASDDSDDDESQSASGVRFTSRRGGRR